MLWRVVKQLTSAARRQNSSARASSSLLRSWRPAQASWAALTDPERRPPEPRDHVPSGPDALAAALRTSKRGSAPGLSGMHAEHLQVLLQDAKGLELLAYAGTCLARAEVLAEVVAALALARLTALRKPNGGVRGSALRPGDTFRRLVSRVLDVDTSVSARPTSDRINALRNGGKDYSLVVVLGACPPASPAKMEHLPNLLIATVLGPPPPPAGPCAGELRSATRASAPRASHTLRTARLRGFLQRRIGRGGQTRSPSYRRAGPASWTRTWPATTTRIADPGRGAACQGTRVTRAPGDVVTT